MKQLQTVQTQENLNKVFAMDEIGPGGAHHIYSIQSVEGDAVQTTVFFQKGARKEVGSQHGVIDSDLLEIVRDRLNAFQEGPFASEYNAQALVHIEQALVWMNKRVEDRIARNVLGKETK